MCMYNILGFDCLCVGIGGGSEVEANATADTNWEVDGADIYTAGDSSTTVDHLCFKSAMGNGGKKVIVWRDASNVLGRISLEYESASPAISGT